MKKQIFKYGLGLLLLSSLSSCDEFIRTEVVKEIYVNKSIINDFVGAEIQLIASPTDGTYQYQWTSEDPTVASVTADGKVKLLKEGFTNIVVSSGAITEKVEIYSVVRIPLEDIILSESYLEFVPNSKKIINVQRVPDNANDIPNAVWLSENPSVATVNEKGEIVGVSEGVTNIVYKIGDIEKKVKVDVSFTRPFNGPHIVGTGITKDIAAADFDIGGQGYGFNDDSNNNVGNDNYRKGKGDAGSYGVEIEGNGNNIGYINNGEWLQYTIEANDAGVYQFDANLSANGNGKFHVEVDGEVASPTIDVPSNGSWSSWRYFPSTPINITLKKGQNKVKFVIDQSGFNLKGLRFRK